MKKRSYNSKSPRDQGSAIRWAFTLTELLVVMFVIGLVLAIALPGIVDMFSAGADAQGRNVFSAMLGAARGEAVKSQSYAVLHVQIGTDENCWVAILKYDSAPASASYGKFVPVSGYAPRQMPGHVAFGEISDRFVSGGSYKNTVDSDLRGFTTFNVIFGPDGAVTSQVDGSPPVIETDVKIFGGDEAKGKQQIWTTGGLTLNEPGVRTVTIFSYETLKAAPDRKNWLDMNGQFLCINPYTGKLLPTK